MNEIEAEALRRYPIPYAPAKNAAQRKTNLVHAALRKGFIEGATWLQDKEK
ncbi:hypothetical protein SEA_WILLIAMSTRONG_27 [Microbacterium phage WilliamStrong]|nr:hypothetical protein SEA_WILLIAMSTRONG_27 [Microbacterium phage WilliamStrong]